MFFTVGVTIYLDEPSGVAEPKYVVNGNFQLNLLYKVCMCPN